LWLVEANAESRLWLALMKVKHHWLNHFAITPHPRAAFGVLFCENQGKRRYYQAHECEAQGLTAPM
jgi:hypothetical protein